MRQRREVHYSGSVQGVGFRYTVRSLARRFDLGGFIKNLADGRVLLVVEGEPEAIEGLLGDVRAEMGHYIRRADETPSAATGEFTGFEIRF